MQQPRPPVIENNQKYMMDTLEELSGGASGAKSDGPTTTSPEEIAPSLLYYILLRYPGALRPPHLPLQTEIPFEYEPYILPTEDFYN